MLSGYGLGIMLSGKIAKKTSARLWCCLGSVLLALSLYLSSFINNLVGFAISYSILGGFILGFLYIVPVAHSYRFFIEGQGIISSIHTLGVGIGVLLLTYAAKWIIGI